MILNPHTRQDCSLNMFSSMMFSSLMVVVMSQMLLLQISATDVSLSIDPAEIPLGVSPFLDANCTASFTGNPAMARIISLTVSRGSNTPLAIITFFSPDQVNVISSEGITADGVINPGGQSYIHLHWDYPTDTQNGTYQCVARGMEPFGSCVEESDAADVILDHVNMTELIDKIVEMDKHTKELEEKLSQNEDCIKDREQIVSDTSTLAPTPHTKILSISSTETPPLSYVQDSYWSTESLDVFRTESIEPSSGMTSASWSESLFYWH